MPWIRAKSGELLNLSHAHTAEYDAAKGELNVWWAFELPAAPDRTECAGVFDIARLTKYNVLESDWSAFISQALPFG